VISQGPPNYSSSIDITNPSHNQCCSQNTLVVFSTGEIMFYLERKKSVKIEVSAAFSCERQQRKHRAFPETEASSFLILAGFCFPQVVHP